MIYIIYINRVANSENELILKSLNASRRVKELERAFEILVSIRDL